MRNNPFQALKTPHPEVAEDGAVSVRPELTMLKGGLEQVMRTPEVKPQPTAEPLPTPAQQWHHPANMGDPRAVNRIKEAYARLKPRH